MFIKKLQGSIKVIYNNELFNIVYADDDTQTPRMININLAEHLNVTKNSINDKDTEWTTYKKYTNPYEYIGTNCNNVSISNMKPISRAFYKMVDIYNEFKMNELLSKNIQSFHLAEGPGGFIQALNWMRKNENDRYIGMTLRPNEDYNFVYSTKKGNERNFGPPSWFKGTQFLKKNKHVSIEYGSTNDGDINKVDNLKYIMDKYANSMDLVTGDGGFDFSSDYNHQEQNVYKLLFSQVIYALTLQKYNGIFILKMFDLFHYYSVELLYLLSLFYKDVYICKPNTSRIANSEKYIVCIGYKYVSAQIMFHSFIQAMREIHIIGNMEKQRLLSILKLPISVTFINEVEEANTILGQQQIENINFTLSLSHNNLRNKSMLENLSTKHKNMCIQWCKTNKIPYNNILKKNVFVEKS
jgi:23S rRNA U2552 (ribose-2'-O)-methylase RlmE/FtsJ